MKRLFSLTALAALVASAHAGEVEIVLDQAKLYSLQKPVGSVVVANPSVADVSVHSTKELVLFGKMPGLTNLFVFGTDGKPMGSVALRVSNPRANMVTVFAGSNRITMSCSSVCEHTYTIGDGINGIRVQGTDVASQASMRFGMASNAAGGSTSASQTPTAPMIDSPDDDPES
ncbi:MAG: pilus assembly protein N-terminal domain-containing protein [Parvularcula sp.]